jgi:hypothetical protein
MASVPLSFPLLALRSCGTRDAQRMFLRADASVPTDPAILGGRTLVLLDPPLEPLAFYMQYQRAARGAPRPARTRVLATSGGRALRVERIDDRTLRLSSEAGLLSRTADMMMRSPGRDLPAGAAVEVAGLRVEIERVTADGRPAAARFRFDRPLEDPQLLWMQWGVRERGYVPFTPPAIGAAVTLPAVDLVDLFTK